MRLVGDFYAYLWPGLTIAEMQMYGNNCNSCVVANALPGGKHILVDPGQVVNEVGRDCLGQLLLGMEKDGLAVEDVGLVVVTHTHPDHYGAAEEIRSRSGALVAMGRVEDEFFRMATGQMSSVLKSMGINLPEINPDILLEEGELEVGQGMRATVLLTPGHSPGHIGIYWAEAKVYMGGDLIFYGSTGRVDFPGGSAQLLREGIERVAKLDIEYLVTGHQYGGPGIIAGRDAIKANFEVIRREIFPYL